MGGLTFVGVIPLRNFPLKDGPPQGNFRFAGHPLIKHLEGSIECIGEDKRPMNFIRGFGNRSMWRG